MWRDPEKDPPNDSRLVLICSQAGRISIARIERVDWVHSHWYDYIVRDKIEVKAWQELPAAPGKEVEPIMRCC